MFPETTDHRAIVQNLSDKLRAHYIFPDIAEQISARLQKYLEDGEYADITEDELLALALTMRMREVSHDEHLWVQWHPEPLPDETRPLKHSPQWQDERKLEARLDNHGLHKVERLPGNVGYIDIRYLHRPAWGGDTAVAAMNFLANTDALVIDLRKCTGGYPGMIALMMSYLFGEESIHLSSSYWREEEITQQYWTLPYVPGKHYADDKTIYILISRVTFSAGEEFASILQRHKRAIVLGDQTDGGAHPGTSYRLSSHFEVFIPIGRAINPITEQDLEGVGVTPDILIPQEQAFTAAYSMALRAILARFGESSSGALQGLVTEAQKAIQELSTNQKICTQCGYPNPPYRDQCKNCEEQLPDDPAGNSPRR